MPILTDPICCGETLRLVLISPLYPGPDGWGRRCKACGRRWSLDDEPYLAESRQRAETAVALARRMMPHIPAGASRADALDAVFAQIFGDAICCSECGVGYTDDYWARIYSDGVSMLPLTAFVCDACDRDGDGNHPAS